LQNQSGGVSRAILSPAWRGSAKAGLILRGIERQPLRAHTDDVDPQRHGKGAIAAAACAGPIVVPSAIRRKLPPEARPAFRGP
jgi:hypothetical protein